MISDPEHPRISRPHLDASPLVAGHFHERAGYSTWRQRGTRDWLLIATVSGGGRFGFDAGRRQLITTPGDLVLIRPGTLHDYGVEDRLGRWELLWAHFNPRPHWIEWLNWPAEAPGLMRLRLEQAPLRRRVIQRLRDCQSLAIGADRLRLALAMNALEQALLWCDGVNPRRGDGGLDPRVREAIEYICGNLAARLDLETLASVAGLSVSRLGHLFRQQAGLSVQRFVESQRLARGRQLLDYTALSVKEISQQVGFSDPFYFTQRFTRIVGISPRGYRRRDGGRL